MISKYIFITDKDMGHNYLLDQVMNFYRVFFHYVNKDLKIKKSFEIRKLS